jgi:hypothetical protein
MNLLSSFSKSISRDLLAPETHPVFSHTPNNSAAGVNPRLPNFPIFHDFSYFAQVTKNYRELAGIIIILLYKELQYEPRRFSGSELEGIRVAMRVMVCYYRATTLKGARREFRM